MTNLVNLLESHFFWAAMWIIVPIAASNWAVRRGVRPNLPVIIGCFIVALGHAVSAHSDYSGMFVKAVGGIVIAVGIIRDPNARSYTKGH